MSHIYVIQNVGTKQYVTWNESSSSVIMHGLKRDASKFIKAL